MKNRFADKWVTVPFSSTLLNTGMYLLVIMSISMASITKQKDYHIIQWTLVIVTLSNAIHLPLHLMLIVKLEEQTKCDDADENPLETVSKILEADCDREVESKELFT